MIPRDAFFSVNFVLSEKAVGEAMASDLPDEIKTALSEATQYVEGTSLMFDVNNETDVVSTRKLIEIKHNN